MHPLLERSTHGDWPRVDPKRLELLSAREGEVLRLAASGLLDKEIGAKLGISLNTLKTHWARIRRKVGEVSRIALTAAYVEQALSRNLKQSAELKTAFEPDRLLVEDWEYDYQTGMLIATDEINRQNGLEPGVPHSGLVYNLFYHPDDQQTANEGWNGIRLSSSSLHHITFRRVWPSGVNLVSTFVRVLRDAEGTALKLRGNQISAVDGRPNINSAVMRGEWRAHTPSGELSVDSMFRSILSIESDLSVTVEKLLDSVHPDFRKQTREFMNQLADSRSAYASLCVRPYVPKPGATWLRIDAPPAAHSASPEWIAGAILAFE